VQETVEKVSGVVKGVGLVERLNFDVVQFREEILALAAQRNRCPDCSDHPFLISKDGDLVCPLCGLVVAEDSKEEETIPFDSEDMASGHSESHFNPGSESSDGHGLGSNTQARKQGHSASRLSYAVLSKFVDKPTVITCPHCETKFEVNDLPLRAQHLTTITEQYEHPKIKTVLRLGRVVMKDLGYDQSTPLTWILKNQVGLIERTVTQKLIDRNVRVNLREVAKACVLKAVEITFGDERYRETFVKLKPDDGLFKDVVNLWSLKSKKEVNVNDIDCA
jgi:uncharacterized Zn finger protein (UPF0148 family)